MSGMQQGVQQDSAKLGVHSKNSQVMNHLCVCSYFTTQYPIHILDWRRSQLPGPVKQLPSDQRFTPPELLVYGPASRASDIWQIGATLLSLLTGADFLGPGNFM